MYEGYEEWLDQHDIDLGSCQEAYEKLGDPTVSNEEKQQIAKYLGLDNIEPLRMREAA